MAAKTQNSPVPSGYLAARSEWDERYGSLIKGARNWRALAILALCGLLVSLVLNCEQAKQVKVIPYLVTVDTSGKILSQGAVTHAPVADDRMKRAVLSDWVEKWRMVSNDMTVNRSNIDRVYAMIANGSAASNEVSDFYRAGSPFERGEKETVSVQVQSVFATSNETYEVDWTEKSFDLDGNVTGTQNWKGAFTLAIHPSTSDNGGKQMLVNPLGIYVTNLNISKVL